MNKRCKVPMQSSGGRSAQALIDRQRRFCALSEGAQEFAYALVLMMGRRGKVTVSRKQLAAEMGRHPSSISHWARELADAKFIIVKINWSDASNRKDATTYVASSAFRAMFAIGGDGGKAAGVGNPDPVVSSATYPVLETEHILLHEDFTEVLPDEEKENTTNENYLSGVVVEGGLGGTTEAGAAGGGSTTPRNEFSNSEIQTTKGGFAATAKNKTRTTKMPSESNPALALDRIGLSPSGQNPRSEWMHEQYIAALVACGHDPRKVTHSNGKSVMHLAKNDLPILDAAFERLEAAGKTPDEFFGWLKGSQGLPARPGCQPRLRFVFANLLDDFLTPRKSTEQDGDLALYQTFVRTAQACGLHVSIPTSPRQRVLDGVKALDHKCRRLWFLEFEDYIRFFCLDDWYQEHSSHHTVEYLVSTAAINNFEGKCGVDIMRKEGRVRIKGQVCRHMRSQGIPEDDIMDDGRFALATLEGIRAGIAHMEAIGSPVPGITNRWQQYWAEI